MTFLPIPSSLSTRVYVMYKTDCSKKLFHSNYPNCAKSQVKLGQSKKQIIQSQQARMQRHKLREFFVSGIQLDLTKSGSVLYRSLFTRPGTPAARSSRHFRFLIVCLNSCEWFFVTRLVTLESRFYQWPTDRTDLPGRFCCASGDLRIKIEPSAFLIYSQPLIVSSGRFFGRACMHYAMPSRDGSLFVDREQR